MTKKLLAIALAFPGIWDAGEAASILARVIRATDRTLDSETLVQFPWLDGSRGTLDFLVTHTLGSFLEVEVTGSAGEDIVAPIGFAGEDGKLAIIEMARACAVPTPGESGTTAGIGQLIQDALDEGAFSILLCQEEPLAFDAGFGAAAALGVRFFDEHDTLLDFSGPGSQLSQIQRIDMSGRSFQLLSSRLFIAQSDSSKGGKSSTQQTKELKRLAKIVRRDAGITVSPADWSASAVEFGLTTLLGAEVRDGHAVVVEASRISEALERGEFSRAIILAPSLRELTYEPFVNVLEQIRSRIERRAIIGNVAEETNGAVNPEPVYSLPHVPVFQAPLRANATPDELRRDLTLRLEKVMPEVFRNLSIESPETARRNRHV